LWLTSHKTPNLILLWQMQPFHDNLACDSPLSIVRTRGYAASGICMTTATSSDDKQRGHRWPATTRGYRPRRSMSAGTVWVQIGQWACPLVWFSMSAFMAFPSLHPTQNKEHGLYQIRKES
jgi:hypothetical protein